MKNNSAFTLLILLLIALSFARGQSPDAQQIMVENDRQNKAPAEYSEMTMKLISKRGKERLRKVVQYRKLDADENQKLLIRFLSPADIKGTGLLTIEHSDRDDDQWLYLPATRKVRRISAAQKGDRFVGTDFTYQDLKNEELDQYDYRLTGTDTLQGIPCYIIEALPNNSREQKESPYSKRVFWISRENYVTLQVQFFDKKGRHYKTYTATDIRHLQPAGKWRAFRMEMRNLQNGHRTVLLFDKIELNRDIPERMFSERELKRGR